MNISVHTFGKTPASMYLAQYLIDKGDRNLLRKVSRSLDAFRSTVNDVIACHLHTDEMKRGTFNRLMIMLDQNARESGARIPDPLASQLVTNIMVGEIKSWKTRCMHTAHLQRAIQRKTPRGETVEELKVTPRRGEETYEERVEKLRDRSRRYLERHGKKNTLY